MLQDKINEQAQKTVQDLIYEIRKEIATLISGKCRGFFGNSYEMAESQRQLASQICLLPTTTYVKEADRFIKDWYESEISYVEHTVMESVKKVEA